MSFQTLDMDLDLTLDLDLGLSLDNNSSKGVLCCHSLIHYDLSPSQQQWDSLLGSNRPSSCWNLPVSTQQQSMPLLGSNQVHCYFVCW